MKSSWFLKLLKGYQKNFAYKYVQRDYRDQFPEFHNIVPKEKNNNKKKQVFSPFSGRFSYEEGWIDKLTTAATFFWPLKTFKTISLEIRELGRFTYLIPTYHLNKRKIKIVKSCVINELWESAPADHQAAFDFPAILKKQYWGERVSFWSNF